jgi:hypothetical protein
MKTRLGVLILVLLTGMILGVGQPALLYGAETPGAYNPCNGALELNLWDPFVNVSFFTLKCASFKGAQLAGQISLAYGGSFMTYCSSGMYEVTMHYTVGLSVDDHSRSPQLYLYTSFTPGLCQGDYGVPGSGGQGDVIMQFLKTVVLQIFPDARDAYLKSVTNPSYVQSGLGFTADITIVVRR